VSETQHAGMMRLMVAYNVVVVAAEEHPPPPNPYLRRHSHPKCKPPNPPRSTLSVHPFNSYIWNRRRTRYVRGVFSVRRAGAMGCQRSDRF